MQWSVYMCEKEGGELDHVAGGGIRQRRTGLCFFLHACLVLNSLALHAPVFSSRHKIFTSFEGKLLSLPFAI